jgi:predicted transcriptional regulator
LLTVPPDLSVDAFVQDRLVVADQQGFPVTDGERFVGMVTRADVRRIPREAWGETKVRDIMVGRAALAVATPDEQATAAFEKLAARDVEQLPVVEGDRLVGLLRRRDLARWLDLQNRGAPLLRQRRV